RSWESPELAVKSRMPLSVLFAAHTTLEPLAYALVLGSQNHITSLKLAAMPTVLSLVPLWWQHYAIMAHKQSVKSPEILSPEQPKTSVRHEDRSTLCSSQP